MASNKMDSDNTSDNNNNLNDVSMNDNLKLKELSPEELKEKEKKINRYKALLRNEETKLLLLTKIRQSQLMKENISSPGIVGTNTVPQLTPGTQNLSVNSTPKSSNNSNRPSVNSSDGQNSQIKAAHLGSRNYPVLNPPLPTRSLNNYGAPPPPVGMPSHRSSTSSHGHHSSIRSGYNSRNPVTTPPNVVFGYPVQDLRNASNQLAANAASPVPTENQTPAQRQAAAKLALRKQLEKTLLQIPPPKPPPPEMHFIPNANNPEFIYYYGLETIVDFLTDSPNQSKPPPDPFECVQCGTDFTPVWKWQDRMDVKRGKPAVICENCVTSNIKKSLKVEHSHRLKTAFVKALQQEQEIEQRIASGAPSPPMPSITPPNGQSNMSSLGSNGPILPQAPPAHSSFSRLGSSQANAAAVANSAALLQKMPNLTAAHQSFLQAQSQLQLQQLAHSLPQPARMLQLAPLLCQYGAMLGKPGVSSDVHRQYLLDMIPQRSMAQNSGFNWKS